MASLFYFRGWGRAPRANASLPTFAMRLGQSPSRQRFASDLCRLFSFAEEFEDMKDCAEEGEDGRGFDCCHNI